MALLHYTLEQLQLYLKWALSKHGEFTPEPTIQPYPGIFVGDLSQLNSLKRNAFSAVVGILFVLAFVGNLSTLYVNSRRKLRPFFRSCLISLACSDLSSTVFCTISYMAQFNAEYLQLWTIGGFMCKFVPFVTTTSVLSGSLTLVAIALDRYLAIMRPVLGLWNPDYRFSVVTMLLIWACSIGASGPLLGIYDFQHVYLLDAEDTNAEDEDNNAEVPEELVVTELELVHMCLAGDHAVGLYYVVLFTLIFIPCIVAFIWLNATIARQLWLRRHFHQEQQVRQQEPQQGQFKSLGSAGSNGDFLMPSTLVSAIGVALPFAVDKIPQPSSPPSPNPGKKTTAASLAREARHRKMVVVVLLMMAVFIFLRLPAWVFLIMRLYGSYSEPIDWLLYFSFGILNLFSCALNPIFYTFLTQTIRTASLVKQKIRYFFGCSPGNVQDAAMPTEEVNKGKWSGCCCGLRPPTFTWRCQLARNAAATTVVQDSDHKSLSAAVQQEPASLKRILSFKHEVFTIYKQCDESTSSASIESSA
ncbi:hypothetical protein KR067_004481 [Drosophila pandora]|nr:hypothetical protein KR067_004481 [Drosophila pandora]